MKNLNLKFSVISFSSAFECGVRSETDVKIPNASCAHQVGEEETHLGGILNAGHNYRRALQMN